MVARLPNLFILGAGRCGTTTLDAALAEHPQVFMCKLKEPTFFCEPFQVVRNPIRYAELFEGAGSAAVVGESSHTYLSTPEAAKTIKAFFPEARFIVIVRHPADRALALYSWAVVNGFETESSFEKALEVEDERFASDRFARRCPHYFWNFMYFRSGLFGEQAARYLELFDRGRFHFTTLYDLTAEPDRVLGEIHEFLGVERIAPPGLPHLGASYGVRSARVQYLTRIVLSRLGGVRGVRAHDIDRLRSVVTSLNLGSKPTMPPQTRLELAERFRPDLERFAALTGVDLLSERPTAEPVGAGNADRLEAGPSPTTVGRL